MKICMYSIDHIFDNGTGGVRRFRELTNVLAEAGHEVFLYSADPTEQIHRNHFQGHSIHKDSESKSENNFGTGSVTGRGKAPENRSGENSGKTSGNKSGKNPEKTSGKRMVGLKSAFGNKALFQEIKAQKFDRVVVFDVRAAFSLAVNGVKNIRLFLRQDAYLYKKIQMEDQKAGKLKTKAMLGITVLTEGFCLKRADRIVVQCQFDLNGLLQRHPLQRKSIRKKSIIQINNINPSWILNGGSPEKREKVYDLAFIGNFKDYRKGHTLLLPALKKMSDEGMPVHAAIIGDGKHLEECREEYRNYPEIEFLGRLSNPIPVVESARLLIVPSFVDSCPNTVLEGLYYEVPVIGANRSGIPEILNNPEWLFEMNSESIVEKIRFYLDAENNEKLLREQSLRRQELLFDWGRIMADIVEKQ